MTGHAGAVRRRSPFADAVGLLGEAGMCAPEAWLGAALFGARPPQPLLVAGAAGELIVRAVVAALLRDGADALIAPVRWLRGINSLPLPGDLPRVVGVLCGADEIREDVLDELGHRCALIVGGSAVPAMVGARGLIEGLDRERIADLEIHAAAGWP